MSATTIAMCSAKGGAGKTIITASFGRVLSSMGKRVLMVDADAATNGLSLFYADQVTTGARRARGTPMGLMEAKKGVGDCHIVKISDNLWLLPAAYEPQDPEFADLGNLRRTLTGVAYNFSDDYDFILMDAQAGSDVIAAAAISDQVSHKVILVSEHDPISEAGVERLKYLFKDGLAYQRTFVLLNKMLPEFQENRTNFLAPANYLSPLPWSLDVIRDYIRKELALNLETGNEFTLSIVQTLRSLLTGRDEEELDRWMKAREDVLRSPLLAQQKEVRAEIDTLVATRKLARKRRRRQEFLLVVSFALAGVVGGLAYALAASGPVLAKVLVTLGLALGGLLFAQRLQRTIIADDGEADLGEEIELLRAELKDLTEKVNRDLVQLMRGGQYPVIRQPFERRPRQ
jgi:cellulose biosynthesis protein BcsQ